MRPVVLRHPVLRRPLGAVPLLPLPALPPDLQDPQEGEVLKVITSRVRGCVVAKERRREEEGWGRGEGWRGVLPGTAGASAPLSGEKWFFVNKCRACCVFIPHSHLDPPGALL